MLLLADAPVLRRGLVSMINETAGMQSVGTPGELRRALTLVESARPDDEARREEPNAPVNLAPRSVAILAEMRGGRD